MRWTRSAALTAVVVILAVAWPALLADQPQPPQNEQRLSPTGATVGQSNPGARQNQQNQNLLAGRPQQQGQQGQNQQGLQGQDQNQANRLQQNQPMQNQRQRIEDMLRNMDPMQREQLLLDILLSGRQMNQARPFSQEDDRQNRQGNQQDRRDQQDRQGRQDHENQRFDRDRFNRFGQDDNRRFFGQRFGQRFEEDQDEEDDDRRFFADPVLRERLLLELLLNDRLGRFRQFGRGDDRDDNRGSIRDRLGQDFRNLGNRLGQDFENLGQRVERNDEDQMMKQVDPRMADPDFRDRLLRDPALLDQLIQDPAIRERLMNRLQNRFPQDRFQQDRLQRDPMQEQFQRDMMQDPRFMDPRMQNMLQGRQSVGGARPFAVDPNPNFGGKDIGPGDIDFQRNPFVQQPSLPNRPDLLRPGVTERDFGLREDRFGVGDPRIAGERFNRAGQQAGRFNQGQNNRGQFNQGQNDPGIAEMLKGLNQDEREMLLEMLMQDRNRNR